jgi:hypothetical protein
MRAVKVSCVLATLLSLWACGLPSSLRRDIGYEHDKLQHAEQQFASAEHDLQHDLSQNAQLFADTSVPAQWAANLDAARAELISAEGADRDLTELVRRNRKDSRYRAEQLLTKERHLREAALNDAQKVESEAANWLRFAHDPGPEIENMQRVHETIRGFDLAPVSATVEKAEQDWPAKKEALATRLAALRDMQQDTDKQWDGTAAARQDAAAGKLTGPEIAALFQADKDLDREAHGIRSETDELRGQCGQLYNSWDKVLIDLDVSRDGRDREYRERIKTVTTHITDVSSHQTETSANEAWVPVSEPAFHAVENDLGMTLAHKDAGLFDSEAQTTPQPAGFAYIAPESQGSNQYGYWTHSGGNTFWTFLPQYLLLRELLWNHDYRPVVIEDYRGYRAAQTLGHSYYGQTTPSSAPKYGTSGTFTQTRYANSRYVQSGGFRSSAYASHPDHSPSAFSSSHNNQRAAPEPNGAGKRFGAGAGSPSGRRFGRSPGAGRRFGGRRR